MASIAVLLTVYNRKDKTLKCLRHLFANPIPEGYELGTFLVDDGSTDGTAEAIRELYPDIHIIQGDGSLYWNRGMWTAWYEAARGGYDFYFWLNDDTYLYPSALVKLLSESGLHEDKAIIVGATENIEKTTITYGGYVDGKKQTPKDKEIEVDFFNGNVVLIPRYVYNILGNLDYRFKHSKGDLDYGLRAGKAGVKMFQIGEYAGICELHKSLDTWCNPNVPFPKRIHALYKPNGMPPMEFFYFDRKYHGIKNAIVHFLSIHLRCMIPKLWMNS